MATKHEKSPLGCSKLLVQPPFTTPLVGRQQELARVMAHYEMDKNGFARVVLVSGEPGIGKTHFLTECAKNVSREGGVVLRGCTSQAEEMPPYLPFLEALGQYIHTASPDELRERVTPTMRGLTTILPDLAVYLSDLPTSSPLPPEQARHRLYEAVREFLQNIALPQTLILVLDDLHWADNASLELLCHIMRRQTSTRLLILGAYRSSEINRNSFLERTLVELNRQRILTDIALRPLEAQEIEQLALNVLGKSMSPELCSLLYTQSEGNPFFAEELLHSWIETGVLIDKDNQWQVNGSIEQVLPPNMTSMLRQRLTRLPPELVDHLRVAAIIGRTFDLALLAAVEEQEIETVEEYLHEAEQARLIQSTEMGAFMFCHDKIRECLYTEVSTSRRRRLHEAVGRTLEFFYEQGILKSHTPLVDLAFHFTRSNDREQGIIYSHRAANRALQNFAAAEAILYYRAALQLLAGSDQRRGELLLGLGEAEFLDAHWEEAVTAYQDAQIALVQIGDFKAAARAAHGLGLAQWRQERLLEARSALENALQFLENCSSIETVRVLVDLSTLLIVYLGHQAEGVAYARRSREIAQDLGDKRLEATASRAIAENLYRYGNDLSFIIQVEEQALRFALTHDYPLEAGECCLSLAMAYYWQGEISHSYELSLRHITFIERCRQPLPYHLLTAYSWPALVLIAQGEWKRAELAVERAHCILDRLASPMSLAFLHQTQGLLAYQREDYVTAEREFQSILLHQQCSLGGLIFNPGLLGLAQVSRGIREEASTCLKELGKLLDSLPIGTLPTAPIMVCMALMALDLEDGKWIAHLSSWLLPFSGQYYWFLVDRVLGMIAIFQEEWQAAERYLAAAEVTALREGLQPELARIYLLQGKLLLAQKDPESMQNARERLHQALTLFEKLEMRDSLCSCSDLLNAPAFQQASTPTPALPANLTQREAAVLKLVAEGKHNSQIALELGISEKTVTSHLTHIFNKTTSENRAAATAFAIRHGLA